MSLAFFGIGHWEILVILAIGAVTTGVVLLFVLLSRKGPSGASPEAYAQLVEENRRLREELAALQRKQA